MLRAHTRFWNAASVLLLLELGAGSAFSQQDYGNRLGQREGEGVAFRAQGPWVAFENLIPERRKQYVRQEMYREYRWRTWEYTNYAKRPYQRYIDPFLQGDYFYDLYGDFLTRGWLIYDWTEERPRATDGSRVLKTAQYASFFRSLVIAADQKGEYSYSMTLGDQVFSTLTPLTFNKAVFNGAQMDFLADAYSVTALFSRISAPGFIANPVPGSFNNSTKLVGGRVEMNLGDFVTVGGTFVNAHNGRGTQESFKGNPFKGALTTGQLQDRIGSLVLRLSDDSPADGIGGAILLADDIEIRTRIGDQDTVLSGNAIGFVPERRGGSLREGVRVADGTEQITLTYQFSKLMEIMDDRDIVNGIENVRFRLVLVNDYKVEVTSDRQTNAEGQPIFLLVTQAEGNINDSSNKSEVVFDYGLPTANQVYGFTVEVNNLMGFNLYTEFDINQSFRQYPNPSLKTHRAFSGIVGDETAKAWMMNLSKVAYPWYFFAEGFYLDKNYNTSPFIVDGTGRIDYEDETRSLYDFVDDNDDQDRIPDQARLFQDPRTASERGGERSAAGFGDKAVFPGWDENNDFISDFNQNSNQFQENRFPDYDEPFLRYYSDRPEFLFGLDLNNNGWIDRFENDNEPDYPYKRDHKGYNVYLGLYITPESRLIIGQERESLISDDRRNATTYALFTLEKGYPRIGRFRVFNMLKKAKDNIQDDLFQWVQVAGALGSQQFIEDPLFARDAWVNTAWFGFDRTSNYGPNFVNKFKYEIVNRAEGKNARLLGIINKVDYIYEIGNLSFQPRFKSEFLRDNTTYSLSGERKEWAGILFLVLKFPVLRSSSIELGLEQMVFQDMLVKEENLNRAEPTGDFRNTVLALQLSNTSSYLGYRLITQLSIGVNRTSIERFDDDRKSQSASFVHVTMYAGLRE